MMKTINELWAEPLYRAIVILIGTVVAAFIVERIVNRGLVRLAKNTETDLDDEIIALARRPIFLTAIFGGLYLATAELLVRLPGGALKISVSVVITLTVALWTGTIMRVGTLLLRAAGNSARKGAVIQPTSLPLFEIVWKVGTGVAAVYFVFLAWHMDLSAWLASAGILGIAVGFGAKDTLANLFAGVFIVIDAPYGVGDVVVLDNNLRGRVTNIGIRSTRILTMDGVEVTVPNGVIGNSTIINENGGPAPKRRLQVPISVAYGSDIDQVRDLLLRCADGVKNVCTSPAPEVRFIYFGASGLDFLLLVWVVEPAAQDRVLDAVNCLIYKTLNEADVEIPFDKRDVYIKEAPAIWTQPQPSA
jgi:MscS family membrane protein